MQIFIEKLDYIDFCSNFVCNFVVTGRNVVDGVNGEFVTGHQVEVLPEREASKIVALYNSVEFWVLVLETHDA